MSKLALIGAALLAAGAAIANKNGSRFVGLSDPPPGGGPESMAELHALVQDGYSLEDLQDLYPDHVQFPNDPDTIGVIFQTRYDGPVLVEELDGELKVARA